MRDLMQEPLYRRIVEEAPDAIIYADREGLVRLWNAGAATIFGFSADEALGQSLDLIIPERLRQRHWDGYHKVMATGETRYGPGELLAVPALRKDGTRISVEFSIAMLRDDRGALLGIAAILRDVTARWERDRALRQQLAAAEARLRPAAPAEGEASSTRSPGEQ
jgi:PAS domain S-box-containing protein